MNRDDHLYGVFGERNESDESDNDDNNGIGYDEFDVPSSGDEYKQQHVRQKNSKYLSINKARTANQKSKRKKHSSNDKEEVLFVAQKSVKSQRENVISDQINSIETNNSKAEDSDNDDAKRAFNEALGNVKKSISSSNNTSTKTNDQFRDYLMINNTNVDDPTPPTAAAASIQTNTTTTTTAPSNVLPKVSLKSLGSWEKHTKGFGSKLLSKFGFTGRLGAKETGVSQSIEVVVRPNGVGLGFGDVQEASSLKVNKQIEAEWRGVALVESDKEDEEKETNKNRKAATTSKIEFLAQSKSWKRSNATTAVSRKQQLQDSDGSSSGLLTASEIIKSQQQQQHDTASKKKQVVLDMRYETVRVLTDLSHINNSINDESEVMMDSNITVSSSSNKKKKLGEEFLYNINLVTDMIEIELTNNIRKLGQMHDDSSNGNGSNTSSIRQQLANITRDMSLYEKQLIDNQLLSRLERLQSFAVALDQMEQQVSSGSSSGIESDKLKGSSSIGKGDIFRPRSSATISTLTAIFRSLQLLHHSYPQEFVLFGVINLLPTLLFPVLKQLLQHWSPLNSRNDSISCSHTNSNDSHSLKSVSSSSLNLLDNIISEMKACINDYFILTANDFTTADQTRAYCQTLCDIYLLPILRRLITNDWIHPLLSVSNEEEDKYILGTVIHFFTLLQQSFTTTTNTNTTNNTQLDQLMEMILIPKLLTAVNEWHPVMMSRESGDNFNDSGNGKTSSHKKRKLPSEDIYSTVDDDDDNDGYNYRNTSTSVTTTTSNINKDNDTDSPFIHVSLHPWLPLFGNKLSILYPHIRRKMNSFITHCFHVEKSTSHNNNSSVNSKNIIHQNEVIYNMLTPWYNVFDTTSFYNLLSKSLLPKLIVILRQHVTINPSNQDISLLSQVLFLWRDIISPIEYAALWLGEFFHNKWLSTLAYWLCSEDVNLEEVSVWYTGWKQLFIDHGLLLTTAVTMTSRSINGSRSNSSKQQQQQQEWFYTEMNKPFKAALQMMTLKLDDDGNIYEINEQQIFGNNSNSTSSPTQLLLTQVGYTNEYLNKMNNYKSVLESYQQELRIQDRLKQFTSSASSSSTAAASVTASTSASTSKSHRNVTGCIMNVTFKEVVESFATSHNIEFYPLSERESMKYNNTVTGSSSVQGKQMYVFGSIPCYIDQNVLFISSSSSSDMKMANSSTGREWVPVDLEALLQKVLLMMKTTTKSQ